MISKISLAFMLLAVSVFASEHKSMVATQFGVTTMSAVALTTKVPRSQCKVCNGTGKVKAGDTVTVVMATCPNCYDDSKGGKGESVGPGELPKACNCAPCTCGRECKCKNCKCDPKDVGRSTRIVMFTAKWCKPCNDMDTNVLPIWKKKGHTIGDRFTELESIDFDTNLELAKKYNVTMLPTFFVLKAGKVSEPLVGYRNEHQLEQLLK